ncbi:24246_t:CDS:2 [Racocetra persica]|uniref:24246_t:CDS:1 n=1 Tax=Racocetra persica TaxID=160502 RepID=A0ACA9K9R3_9GLOM|nr:24246_t:CDS:2 [Racocetra persica]
MVQSCKHPYKTLMNNVLLLEQFHHLCFVPTIYTQISPSPPKKYYSQQVIWIEDGGEELWAPSLNYTLNDNEFVALSNFYQANLNKLITELPDWGVKYSKLRTKEGYNPYYIPHHNLYEDFKKNYAVAAFNLRTSIMALKQDLNPFETSKYGGSISDIVNSTDSVEEVTMKFLLDHYRNSNKDDNPKTTSPAYYPLPTEIKSRPTEMTSKTIYYTPVN